MEPAPGAHGSAWFARAALVLQLADQQLSDWGLPGDPPILTEHVDAQFGWMLEAHPDAAVWRAQYPDDSGLEGSPALRRLHQPQ